MKKLIPILLLLALVGCKEKAEPTKPVEEIQSAIEGRKIAYELGKTAGLIAYQTVVNRHDKDYSQSELKALADTISNFYNIIKH